MKTNNQARIVLKKTAVSGNMLLRIVGVLSLLAAAPSLLPPDTAKANDDGGWVVLWDADNDGMEPEKMAQASKADKKSKQYKHCAEKPLGSGGEWTYYGDGDKCQVKGCSGVCCAKERFKCFDAAKNKCCDGKAYDATRRGCCKRPNGKWIITRNPDIGDPCKRDSVQNICKGKYGKCRPFGITVCYNGNKVGCECDCKNVINAVMQACIKAHEEGHVKSDNVICRSCKTNMAVPKDKEKFAEEHCALWKEDITCLKNCEKDSKECADLLKEIRRLIGFFGCK